MSMTFKEVDKYLQNLELKSYPIKEIFETIRSISSLQSEGIFADQWSDNYYDDLELLKHPETGEKISLLDCYVDITYQRLLRLKVLVDHLRAKGVDGEPLEYDKMCAGSIDIAIRPDGEIFVWDGFRRSLIALLKGIKYPSFSIFKHSNKDSIKKCRGRESFAFKKRNGDNEAMAKEELYKAGIFFSNPKDLETKDALSECKLDVLKTIPDAKQTLQGFAIFEKSLHSQLIDKEHLVTAARLFRNSWTKDSTVAGYAICGLATYIQLLATDSLTWSYNVTGFDKECDFLPLLKKYAQNKPQTSLTGNRLSNMGVETVAFRFAANVFNLNTYEEQVELAGKLGFDQDGIGQMVKIERS